MRFGRAAAEWLLVIVIGAAPAAAQSRGPAVVPLPATVAAPEVVTAPWMGTAPSIVAAPWMGTAPSIVAAPWMGTAPSIVAATPNLFAQSAVVTGPSLTPSIVRSDTAAAEPFFTTRDAWRALGFIAGTIAMAPLDQRLANALQDSSLQVHGTLRDVAATLRFLGFPGSAIIGTTMYATGRVADMPRVAAIGLHGTEAVVLSYLFVWTGKGLFGRARPQLDTDDPFNVKLGRGFRGGSEYVSFPSGHTAAAFAVAAAVTAETSQIWPEATPYAAGALYTGALLVGVSRMYHNRHWASDVVAGAAIGTFSGLKVIRYHYRNTDNRIDRWLLPTAVVPTTSGATFVWNVPVRN